MSDEIEVEALSVREAGPGDAGALAALLAAFLEEEGKAAVAPPAPGDLAGWLSPPDPMIRALIGLNGGRPLGYLAYYRAFSLFKPSPVMLVENLFVMPEARRLGLGRVLMRGAAREALRLGYDRLELHVVAQNQGAQRFYRSLGLEPAGESVYRIEDEVLRVLAGPSG